MCLRRRVYFSCLHEDHDVTPPRSLIFCSDAKPSSDSSTSGDLRPCAAAESLPLTSKHDFVGAIIRSEPCEACAAGTGQYSFPLQSQTTSEAHENKDRSIFTSSSDSATILSTASGDTAEPKDEDLLQFYWDTNSGSVPDALGISGNPAGTDQPSGFSDGAQSFVTVQDFQLYDGEDEFADELQEIGGKKQ
ncbi:hypothetical protein F5Y13DRAFT_189357 [Hypoxylon sp. FL1857]|nr:hypothetical protein F5Y13DRAFT_189357 [Hypoxylon sp. FL1857]